MTHITIGNINVAGLPDLDVNAYITDFFPAAGSPYGGFDITVSGYPLLQDASVYDNYPHEWNLKNNHVIIGDLDCNIHTITAGTSLADPDVLVCTTATRVPSDPVPASENIRLDVIAMYPFF